MLKRAKFLCRTRIFFISIIPFINNYATLPSDGDELAWNEIWQKVNGELIKRHLVVETLKPTKEEWVEMPSILKALIIKLLVMCRICRYTKALRI